jgi:hypothetical protein
VVVGVIGLVLSVAVYWNRRRFSVYWHWDWLVHLGFAMGFSELVNMGKGRWR